MSGDSDRAVRPEVLVLDVNGTLSGTGALADAFAAIGADPRTAEMWFASILRDGIAASAAGRNVPFVDLARALLPAVLVGQHVDLDAAVEDHVLGALSTLPPRPDLAPGVRALRRAGFRLVTLTNGSAAISERLLSTAGVRSEFELLLSVTDAPGWKPTPGAYRLAVDAVGLDPAALMLVAAHPWDIEGAAAAGLRTAYVDRAGTPYPAPLARPELVVHDLVELAERLAG